MSQLTLRLCGPPTVLHGDDALTFRTHKTLALLLYLVVERTPQRRAQLCALLWPERDSAHARALLRRTLAFLRDTLAEPADGDHLIVTAETLAINPRSALATDLDLLHAAVACLDAPSRSHGEDPAALIGPLQGAVDAYAGEFLADFSAGEAPAFEDWVAQHRAAVLRSMERIFERLSALLVATGELRRALAVAARWAACSPLDERAYRRLIEAHKDLGNRTAALRVYDDLRALLARELETEPSPEIAAFAARLRAARLPRSAGHDVRPEPGAGQVSSEPLRSLTLVGRDDELGVVTARFEAARRGATGVVLLSGEAGIGKTRLAGELLTRAAMDGADVLAGRAFEAGGRLPYGPLVAAFRERIARENAPEDLLDDVWLAELSRLLPELRERYPHLTPTNVEPPMARMHLFEAVARLGQALAERAPLVVFVDDLHWADEATLHLLHYAAHRWADSGAPVLLLLAARAEVLAEEPLATWLSGLQRDLAVTALPLGPLRAADVTALLESLAAPPAGMARDATWQAVDACGHWLFAETGGQPFYILETLKALLDRGLVMIRRAPDGAWAIDLPATIWGAETAPGGLLPSGVRAVLQARFQRLSAAGAALLAAGAVLGHGFSFDRLRHVADLDETAALAALDEVLRAHLWQPATGAGSCYDFRHDKIRDVAYDAAGEARRRVYHRRALTLLSREEAPAAECAHHAILAGEDAAAIRHGIAAGAAALALFAVADAIAHFERARGILQGTAAGRGMRSDPADEETARLYLHLGRAHELNNDLPSARAVYKELGAIAEGVSRPGLQAMALTRLATVTMQGAWDMDAALDLLRRALPLAEAGGDPAALAETEWTLAQVKAYGHDTLSALAHAERALSLARGLDAPELRAKCLSAIGFAALLLGHNGRSLEAAQEARTLYAATGNRVLEADTLRMIADARFQRGQAREAIALAREALQISERANNLWGKIWGAKELVAGLLDCGAYAEARGAAQAALDLARTQDEPVGLMMALTLMGRACAAVYALDDARAYQHEALAVNALIPRPPFTEVIRADLCASAARAGDWEAAAPHARQALAARDNTFHLDTGLTRWLETAALIRVGEVAPAEADLRRFGVQTAHCARYRLPHLRGLALVAEARGNPQDAIALLLDAVTLAASLGLPGEAWQIDTALAGLYARVGARDDATTRASQAERGLRHLAEALGDPVRRDEFVRAATSQRREPR